MTVRELMKIDIRTLINVEKDKRISLDCIVVDDTLIGKCHDEFYEYLDYKVKEIEVRFDETGDISLSIAYIYKE